jgi:hypothetical protein
VHGGLLEAVPGSKDEYIDDAEQKTELEYMEVLSPLFLLMSPPK